VHDCEKTCVMYLADEQGQNICVVCCAMSRKLKTLKKNNAYKIFMVNVSERCYMIGKKKNVQTGPEEMSSWDVIWIKVAMD